MYDLPDRLARSVLNILLAMLNATLILVALCLFLGLRLAHSVQDYSEEIAQDMVNFEPLRTDIRVLAAEIAAMRADLGTIRGQSGELSSEAGEALAERIDEFDARMEGMRERAEGIQARLNIAEIDPEAAIRLAAAEIASGLAALAGCARPSAVAEPQG